MTSFYPLASADSVKINDGVDELKIDTNGSLLSTGVSLTSATNATIAYNNSQTIYTVPAGKTAKIYSFNIYHTSIAVAATNAISLVAGTQTIYKGQALANTTIGTSFCVDFGNNYILLTATQTVVLTTGTNGQSYATIQYLEENV
jgi:hypothetical protein